MAARRAKVRLLNLELGARLESQDRAGDDRALELAVAVHRRPGRTIDVAKRPALVDDTDPLDDVAHLPQRPVGVLSACVHRDATAEADGC